MMVADTLSALSTLGIWLLMMSGSLNSYHLYAANAFASVLCTTEDRL
jgi:hypothetical protein